MRVGRRMVVGIVTIAIASGIPAHPASASTSITSNISANTHWTLGGSPYVINRVTLTVLSGVTLTIDPGVRVEFNTGWTNKIVIAGNLVAIGTAANPIVFTSSADSLPGQWYYMKFDGTGTGTLDYVDIRRSGGLQSSAPWAYGAVRMGSTGAVTLSHAHIWSNYNSGVLATSSRAITIQDSLIEFNDYGVTAIGGSGGAVDITRSTIRDNYLGLFFNHSQPPVVRSTITYSDIVDNDEGISLQEAADNPVSSFPSATHNNIHSNNPGATGNTTVQVKILGLRPDAAPLWDDNYFGETAAGPIFCPFSAQVWPYHVYFEDDLNYPQGGPIQAKTYAAPPPNQAIKCKVDNLAVSEIATDPIDTGAPS